jgi:hypothetical protein
MADLVTRKKSSIYSDLVTRKKGLIVDPSMSEL